jgi:hypothetical protein
MKTIFLSIQEQLASISELKYIDKNWGQLTYEQPPVRFPCVLLDIHSVEYSQLGMLAQQASANIELTVAVLHEATSSHKSNRKQQAYDMMELMDTIHQTLHGWATTDFAPLIRTATQKIEASKGCQIYTMNYKTVWRELKRQNITEIIAEPKITKK